MKPRTKYEKEVVALSKRLPPLCSRYKKQAEQVIDYSKAQTFRGRKTHVIHFVVATTKDGWQVLRHFYLYAVFKYKKLEKCQYLECMQQWFKEGKYVFMALNRQMGWCDDAWCAGQPMSIKKTYDHCSALCDPRLLGYDKVMYAKVTKQFSYLPADDQTDFRVDDMFRAVNVSPMWETLIKNNPEAFRWLARHGFPDSRKKTAAVRIALRHKYRFMVEEWADLVDMLIYLGKDIRNPKFVCPANLKAMHDEISALAESKRRKEREEMEKLRQIRWERQEAERLERQARLAKERAEKDKLAAVYYPKKRKKFFGLIIEGKGIEIRVLQSISEFMEEGVAMGHCVFANAYYDLKKHPNSLIMSARKDGNRVETIEVDLSDYRIIQSRGKHNSATPYHDTIVDLVEANMEKIRAINQSKMRRTV